MLPGSLNITLFKPFPGVPNSMNEVKPLVSPRLRDNGDAKVPPESLDGGRDVSDLPISNWDDYKSWCEKVKENWDVN